MTRSSAAAWAVVGMLGVSGLSGVTCFDGLLAWARAPGSEPPAAANEQPTDLVPLLEPIRAKHKLPALAAALWEDGKIRAIGAVGVRVRSGTDAVTVLDRFHLGSCTKAMTATLVGVLVEEGSLRWDSTLGEIFDAKAPDLAARMHQQYRGVTLAQLLTHRAGVPSDLQEGGLWARLWEQQGTPTEQRAQLAEGVLTRAPLHAPGGEYLYSNAGFALAGYAAELVTGEAWEALMQERVFRPLGITSAGFGAPGTPVKRGGAVDQPRGHRRTGAPVEPGKGADNPPAIGPGGTVHMTLEDWAKFVGLHVRGARGEAGLLLKPETFRRLHELPKGDPAAEGADYAMGWGRPEREWAGGRVLTHAGSNTMWYCVVWAAPEKDFAVLVATNTGEPAAPAACDQTVGAVLQARASTPPVPDGR